MIQPDKFATRLAKVNEARNGRVLPAIKLAKSIVDCFITRPSRKISGYHMEALAVEDLQSSAANQAREGSNPFPSRQFTISRMTAIEPNPQAGLLSRGSRLSRLPRWHQPTLARPGVRSGHSR